MASSAAMTAPVRGVPPVRRAVLSKLRASSVELRDIDQPESRRMRFRMGLNLGDVLVEDDNLMGDGVNVAARLEGMCEPGGVLVSGTVYDHVEGKVMVDFTDMGERQVKHIERPIRVFAVKLDRANPTRSAAAGASPKLPDKPSIAVLPFDNMSIDREQEYFSDGIS